jgi:hypothetical protein
VSDSVWDNEFAPADEVADTIKRAVRDADDRNARITDFQDRVRDIHGPLGVLLRQIDSAYAEFAEASLRGDTTAAEETRINGVMDEAMDALDWLGGAS